MENFEIERILKTANSKKIYIALIIMLALTIGYIYTYYFVTPMYKASTTIILARALDEEKVDSNKEITQSDINLNQKLVSTYSQIIKSDKVLNSVIQKLNLNITESQLKSRIDVQDVNETEILKISVTNEKPELSAAIANELVKAFEEEVTTIYNINNVNVIDEAKVPIEPYNINHIKDIVMSIILGIFISCGVIFLFYIFDTTIKIEEDLEQYVGLNVLASIPLYTKKTKNTTTNEKYEEVITYEDAKSPVAESFRTLRTNLVFGQEQDSLKTILITSSYTSEGKSWISANMAVTFAQTNKKVLIIDCDMRKGRQHHIFKVPSRPGLSNCLTKLDEFKSINDLSQYINETDIPNLYVMTGGDRPSNPSELISSKRMEALVHIMNQIYDVVILDGTPSIIVSDSIILSRIADATMIVTACKETKIKNVQKIKKLIENADGKIAGAIINKMPVSQREYQNKYYYSDRGDRVNLKPLEQQQVQTTTVEQLITRLNTNMQQNQSLIDSVIPRERPNKSKKTQLDKSLFGNNLTEPSYDNVDSIQYKIESINNEIDTIKNIFAQILINSQNQLQENTENKIHSHTLKSKLDDLKVICSNIQEVQNTSTLQRTAEEIKEEIEQISKACENLNIQDEQTKQMLNEQLSIMQENYNNMLDEKLASIKDTDSTEEIKKKITDLQKFISVTVTENNNEKELEELKEKLNDIEQAYKTYDQMLDEKLYKMQKNIIEATKEKRIEKFRDRINSVKEVYSKELEIKLRALEERLISSNNTKNIEDKIDAIKLMYTDNLAQNLSNIENLLLQTTKPEDIQQLENKLEQMQQMYIEKLDLNISNIENIENILSQTTKAEDIRQLEDKAEQIKQAYLEQLEQFSKTHLTQISTMKEDMQKIMEQTTKSKELEEFKESVENIQKAYKEELNEKLNNLESILEKYNNSENIIEIKQEMKNLKNMYSYELEEKVLALQRIINKNAKTAEVQKIQEEMNSLRQEMYDLKQEMHKQNQTAKKSATQAEMKKLIKIEEIKSEEDDPYRARLNNMKAEMEMHKQYKNMITDNYPMAVRQERRERRNPFWRKQEDSLFAVKQSFMEDIPQMEVTTKKSNSVSQILNFNNDSQVV